MRTEIIIRATRTQNVLGDSMALIILEFAFQICWFSDSPFLLFGF